MRPPNRMIRNLQPSDLERVADIWLATHIETHTFIPTLYWQSHWEEVKRELGQAEVYVYEEEGIILGFIGLQGDYLAGIFVVSAAQSRGIGKRLLDFVKNRRKELHLGVYQKNHRALRFYQREGFTIVHEELENTTGELEYLMSWCS